MDPLKKHIRKFARDMRKDPTKAEKKLWAALRLFKSDGFKFRRQVPFDNYIVDFACHEAKLIIEVDGHTHTSEMEKRHDERRQRFLESRRYKILRYWNENVLENIEQVYEEVERFLKPPTPNPSPPGGGGSSDGSSLSKLNSNIKASSPPHGGEGQGGGLHG